MNILIGSHGVGKSTLLQSVRHTRPNIYTFEGFSRPVKDAIRKFRHAPMNAANEQILINELTEWAYLNYLGHPNILAARSILDAIVYTKHLNTYLKRPISTVKLEKVFHSTKRKIDNIFYVPIEFDIEKDRHRYNRETQHLIDHLIKDYIAKHKIKVIAVTGSVKERTKTILKYM